MTLTLPIVVGKKYVRRDGKVITATKSPSFGGMDAEDLVFVNGPEAMPTANTTVYTDSGLVGIGCMDSLDLVADYIEPAKGHPHAALMAQFAEDAAASDSPWDFWQMRDGENWAQMKSPPSWAVCSEYRRKPTATPDPHAASAAEYAKDMALSDKAWEGWEFKLDCQEYWYGCVEHPNWAHDYVYRRKEHS